MFTLSFRRFGDGIYISHTDVLRALNRTMRRAEIGVEYSKGFNRHMSLKLTQPLPLGVASDDEWATIDVTGTYEKEELLQKIRENLPPFLSANCLFETERNPGLAAKITASDYRILCPQANERATEIAALTAGFRVAIEKKGEIVEKDATGLVYAIRVENGTIEARLAFGNRNFRVDYLLAYLNATFGWAIPLTAVTRTRQLLETDGRFVSAREYMEGL